MPETGRVVVEDYDESEELLESIQNGVTCSTCASLIVRVGEYLKRPQIEQDLAGVLEQYLGFLQESDVYMQNGIFKINFAEAALLLQSSVQLYGKKVDLLWDYVIEYLNRNMAYEGKTEANQDQFDLLEERRNKFKRKRKLLEDNTDEPKVPRKTFIVDKASACIQGMHFKDFQSFLSGDVPSDHASTSNPSTSATYHENWLQRSSQSQSSIFEQSLRYGETLPSEDSKESCLLSNLDSRTVHEEIAPIQHDLTEINIYGEKEPMGDYGNSSVFDCINRKFSLQHRQVHNLKKADGLLSSHEDVEGHVLQQWLTEKSLNVDDAYSRWDDFVADCSKIKENLDKTSINNNNRVSERHTTDLFDSILSDKSTSNESKSMGLVVSEKINDSIRKRVDSDIESGVFDTMSSMIETTPAKSEALTGAMSILSDGIGSDSRAVSPVLHQSSQKSDETVVEEVGIEKFKPKRSRIKKQLFGDPIPEDQILPLPKRPRRAKELLRKVITTDLQAFTKFFLQHYMPAEGEGELEPFEDAEEDNEDADWGDLSLIADSGYGTIKDQTDVSTLNDTMTYQTELSPEKEPSTGKPDKSFADIMGQDATNRLQDVLEWKKFITEKIGQQRKSDFDIHVEEGKIIDNIGELGNSVKYNELCSGLSSAEVTHNFIAMLHLANTHNVEISGIQSGKLSNDTLELKLLSTDRHHEHLDEYNAPSAEDMHAKMASVHSALKLAGKRQQSTKYTYY